MKLLKNLFKNKNLTIIFTGIIIFVFFIILIADIYKSYSGYLENNLKTSNIALSNAKDAITTSLETKRRILNSFVLDHSSKINQLIINPDNSELSKLLYNHLKRQLPDLFAINTFTATGETTVDDFDGKIGVLCKTDIRKYLDNKNNKKRIHPNTITYHYDEFIEITHEGKRYLFFASFNLDEITKVIKYATPFNHNLLIINHDDNNLIEITIQGGRDKQDFRESFKLTENEISHTTSSIKIPNTYWSIFDIQDLDTSSKLVSLITPSLFVFAFVSICIAVMSFYLNKNYNEIVRLNIKLEEISIKDALTKLYNRGFFEQHYEADWNRAKRDSHVISIMLIDIDDFKKYNDTFGHVEGDNCLKLVADVLNTCFHRKHEFVARYGGEEFISVIHDDEKSCMIIAENIHEKLKILNEECEEPENKHITVSIGIASITPNKFFKAIKLIENADKALYIAKDLGKNQTVLYKKPV